MKHSKKTPYKDIGLFISEIGKFLNKHQTVVKNHARRISEYFEMSAYNSVVQFYQNTGYDVEVKNLINDEFRYKLSPSGYPQNFSYFQVSRTYKTKETFIQLIYEVHHNLAVESARSKGIFTTPDVCVIKKDSLLRDDDFYLRNSGFYYVPNDKLVTFAEAKNINPFPELLFGFIGILNELSLSSFSNSYCRSRPYHIAPSLMISGTGNFHAKKIQAELERRYWINIFFALFYRKSQPYTKSNRSRIRKTGDVTLEKKKSLIAKAFF